MSHYLPYHRLPPEFLFAIFGDLSATDLTSCATTCKHWSAPAIHTKWSTLWVPLRGLLETMIPAQQSESPWGNATLLDLDQSETDRDLLRRRTSLVSRVYIGNVLPTRYISLLQRHGTPFLPNIREVSVPYLKGYEETLTLVLSPNLKSIELRSSTIRWDIDEPRSSMVRLLAETIPNLRKLIAQTDLSGDDISHLRAFHSLMTLQYFGVCGYSEWRMLATSSPRLEALILNGKSPDPTSPETSPVRPCFTHLVILDLENVRSPHFVVGILRTSAFPKLKRVALYADPKVYPIDQYIGPLISGAPQIVDICLEFYLAIVEDSRLSLTCLTHFTALKALRLVVNCDFYVRGKRFLDVPDILPDRLSSLEHLTLRGRSGYPLSSHAAFSCDTLSATSLQAKFPALHSLSISMNAALSAVPPPSSTFPTVKHLHLSPLAVHGQTKSYNRFAANLAALFPTADLSSESTIALVTDRGYKEWMINKGTEDDLNAFKTSFRKAQIAITTKRNGSTNIL